MTYVNQFLSDIKIKFRIFITGYLFYFLSLLEVLRLMLTLLCVYTGTAGGLDYGKS